MYASTGPLGVPGRPGFGAGGVTSVNLALTDLLGVKMFPDVGGFLEHQLCPRAELWHPDEILSLWNYKPKNLSFY